MKPTDHSDFEKWLHGQVRSIPEPEVSSDLLAAQRRSIYRRLGEPRRHWIPMRWALSLAMLLILVAGGLTLQLRRAPTASVSTAMSDEQLFSDLSAMEQSNEPQAIQPMHGLFQDQ